MPSKTQKSKMPPGKMQFGIIVPIALHKAVKHTAADLGYRISDIYAEGAKMFVDAHRGETSKELEIQERVQKKDRRALPFLEALAKFVESEPRANELEMLRLILGPHMPKEEPRGVIRQANA